MPIYYGNSTKNKSDIVIAGQTMQKVFVGDKLVWQKQNIEPSEGLLLTWDDILNVPVANALSVADWNTFFDLPTFGTPFSSVVVDGNTVNLIGGSGITLKDELFAFKYYDSIVSIEDKSNCVISVGNSCFDYAFRLLTAYLPVCTYCGEFCFNECGEFINCYLPNVIEIGNNCFTACVLIESLAFNSLTIAGEYALSNMYSLTSLQCPLLEVIPDGFLYQDSSVTVIDETVFPNAINLGYKALSGMDLLSHIRLSSVTHVADQCFQCVSLVELKLDSCVELGTSVGNNKIFGDVDLLPRVNGNTITLTIPAALMTCNAGNPDGDIQYLQANNTVTIIQV